MHQEVELVSKRNVVKRVIEDQGTYIRKIFSNEDSFKRELEVVNILNNNLTCIPRIIHVIDQEILYEDLGGNTLLHWMEDAEKNKIEDYENLIGGVLNILKGIYAALEKEYKKEMVLYDMNFRNFILHKEDIYRIDFEQVVEGNKNDDLGKFMAFLLNYYPENTPWKRRFRDKFYQIISQDESYDISEILVQEEMEIKSINRRRNKE